MSLARSSIFFTFGTLLSRFSGLIRDAVLTGVFGASPAMEAFLVANRIPNLFRDMLAEGALGSSFTKIYTTLDSSDPERAKRLMGDAFRAGFILLVTTSVLGWVFAPWLVDCFTLLSGRSDRPNDFRMQVSNLTRTLFPFLGFSILAAMAAGVLQQRGKFFITAVSSSALNIGYILGAAVFAYSFREILPESFDQRFADRGMVGLSIGVLLGGVLHFFAQFFFIWRGSRASGPVFKISPKIISKDLIHVFTLMAPAAIASSAGSINLLVNTNFATSLESGAVTWLNYAFRLFQLPIGIFAVAVGSVSLPLLTRAIVKANHQVDEHVSGELQNSLEFITWLMLPCFLFLVFNSLPVVELLFQQGRYTHQDSVATANALFAYGFGVMGYGLIKVLSSFYYAVERTKYAMKVGFVVVGANFILNALLVKKYGHVGLAFTSALTLSLNALLLLIGLRVHKITLKKFELLRAMFFMVFACISAALLQFFSSKALSGLSFEGLSGLKLRSGAEVLVNLLLVCIVFIVFGLLRLGWSPKYALSKVRSRAKTR